MSKNPLFPKNPERVCWGCDKYCPADALDCGNGTVRTQHPVEIFGEDWLEFSSTKRDAERESSGLQLLTVGVKRIEDGPARK